MANVGLESASSISNVIGRYFFVVSVIPSMLLVVWVALLASSGAWVRPPDWDAAATSLADTSLGGIILLFLLALTLATALHPLQFVLVQLLEGYWGSSDVAVRLHAARVAEYRRRRKVLYTNMNSAARSLRTARGTEAAMLQARFDESNRELLYLPDSYELLMPTRLGNVLRRHEAEAGSTYGLSATTFTGHLALVAPPEHVRYLNDQRVAVDFAVRCCLVGLLATLATVVFLWQHGMWLLLAIPLYLVAYLSYRGSVVAARHYGRALETLVDLNRFELYERLRLKLPDDTRAEQKITGKLTKIVEEHDVDEVVEYSHQTAPVRSAEETPRVE